MARAKGNKYVSRQNLTLINSKPLIYYVLKTASSINTADVYVSTDSNEIKEYSESQGVNVIYGQNLSQRTILMSKKLLMM